MTDDIPDPRWTDRFAGAAEDDDADWFDVRDDLERGRAALLRRRVLLGSASAMAAAVVAGTTLVTSGTGVSRSVPLPAASEAVSPTPTYQEPAVTLEPSPEEPDPGSPTPVGGEGGLPGRAESAGWRNGVFEVAASVLDPERSHLNYDTRSLQAGSDGRGGLSMGIKMGWTVPGQDGEGLVEVEVTDMRGPDSGPYPGAPVRPRTLADGSTVSVGHDSDGTVAVSYEQPGGEVVWVVVSPLFGNNSVVPVEGMDVPLRDVIRLAQDERLDLPPH